VTYPYCSNKNCQLPDPETLNRLHQESKLTWKKIAKDIYKVSERTIRRHARQSEREKQKIKQVRGRKRKIDDSCLDSLRDYTVVVSRISFITQTSLAKIFSCSQSTICLSLKRAGAVYKVFTYQSIEQLRLKNKAKIDYFINITLPYLLKIGANIFFLDETGFHLNMVRRKGYGLVGKPPVKQKLGDKGKNHTLMFLTQIAGEGKLIHRELIEGAMKTKDLHKFLTNFNPPNNGKKNVIIMDNLRVHKATKSCVNLKLSTIAELLSSKNVEIIFLPSYTPELNPIERFNHLLKGDVRSIEARTKERLESVIEERVKSLYQEDLKKYLGDSIRECLMKIKSTAPPEDDKFMWDEKQ